MRSPLPHLRDATVAASRIVLLQRDLAVLNAELAATRQAKRIGFGVAALIFLNLTVTLTLFWVSWMLREAGWKPGWLALVSLLFFGALTGLAAFLAVQVGKKRE